MPKPDKTDHGYFSVFSYKNQLPAEFCIGPRWFRRIPSFYGNDRHDRQELHRDFLALKKGAKGQLMLSGKNEFLRNEKSVHVYKYIK